MSDVVPILITGYSIGCFGLASSLISLWMIYRIPILHNAFGFICAAQSIVDGSILFSYVFIAFTLVIINPEAKQNNMIMFVGIFATFCNSVVPYLQLLKAINRSFAIIFPTKYHNSFTIRKTILYLIFVSILSIVPILMYISSSCYVILTSTFTFNYIDPICIEKMRYLFTIVNTWNSGIILAVILLCDAVTLFYLRMFRKQIIQHNKKTKNADIRFFFQAILSSISYALMWASPRIFIRFANTPFLLFITATGGTLLFHATNEFV